MPEDAGTTALRAASAWPATRHTRTPRHDASRSATRKRNAKIAGDVFLDGLFPRTAPTLWETTASAQNVP